MASHSDVVLEEVVLCIQFWSISRIVLVLLLVMMKVISKVLIIFPKKGMQVLKLMIHHIKCGLQQKVL